MEEQDNLNLQPPTPLAPLPKSHKFLWISIFIAIVLIAVAALALWPRHKAVAPVLQQSSIRQTVSPTLAQERALVDAHSKLNFPAVTASTSMQTSLLPTELSEFILASATQISINELTFADGSNGYSIIYNEPGQPDDIQGKLTLLNFQNNTVQKAGYSLVSGMTTQLAANLEEQNSNYQIRVNINSWQGNSMVNILARQIK